MSRFLPDNFTLMLVATVVLASFFPVSGVAAGYFGLATKVAIGLLFFLHGARLSRDVVIAGFLHWKLHLTILAATFVLFPIDPLECLEGFRRGRRLRSFFRTIFIQSRHGHEFLHCGLRTLPVVAIVNRLVAGQFFRRVGKEHEAWRLMRHQCMYQCGMTRCQVEPDLCASAAAQDKGRAIAQRFDQPGGVVAVGVEILVVRLAIKGAA